MPARPRRAPPIPRARAAPRRGSIRSRPSRTSASRKGRRPRRKTERRGRAQCRPIDIWGGRGISLGQMTVRTAIALLAVAALAAGSGASEASPAKVTNGRIAFALQLNTEQLFMVRPNGSGFRRLTEDLGVYYQGVKSPDGGKLAFSAGGHGKFDIYVQSLASGARTNL